MVGQTTSRNICFTLNNPTENTVEWSDKVRYAVWQLEKGESGTPHLQGYVEFSAPVSYTHCKTFLSQRVHLEKRYGTREQARVYCMKEEGRLLGPWEYGEWTGGQGSRSDLLTVIEMCKEGKTEKEICEAAPEAWGRNYKVIERWKLLNESPRKNKTAFHVFVGDAGTGKTRRVFELSPNAFMKRPGKWFDGYDGNRDLVLDEIDKHRLPLGDLLHMADRYPMQLETKGGTIQLRARHIYATSNIPVEDWYPNLTDQETAALMRRIDTKTTYRWVEDGDVKSVRVEGEVYGIPLPCEPTIVLREPVVDEILTPPDSQVVAEKTSKRRKTRKGV